MKISEMLQSMTLLAKDGTNDEFEKYIRSLGQHDLNKLQIFGEGLAHVTKVIKEQQA